jgi:hypothetical protein
MQKIKKILALFLFCAGLFLLLLNLNGIFSSLRNPEIYQAHLDTLDGHTLLSEQQFYNKIAGDSTDHKAYELIVNDAVHNGMVQYWGDQGVDKFHLHIPFNENYILYTAGFLFPNEFNKYELLDYHQAVERAVGLCSQHAIVATAILSERGIPARIIGLDGHVVLQAQVDVKTNEWWIFDPDYGVVIPNNIDQVEQNPQIIAPYYARAGYSQSIISDLESIYGPEGNVKLSEGVNPYSPKKAIYEPLSYFLIWVIPFGFMTPGVFVIFRIVKKRKSTH